MRRSARLAVASPCPVLIASSPTPAAPNSPAVVASPVPLQQSVATEDESAEDEPATVLDSQAADGQTTGAGDDTHPVASPICTPEKPQANGLGSRLAPRSPFQPLSPATPAPRLLTSFHSSEDSDSEVGDSLVDDSSSQATDPQQFAVIEAFQRLTVRDSPAKAPAGPSSSETAFIEDSVLLTATEVESSEDEFDDELDESVELEAICEEEDGDDEKSTDPSSASETEAEHVDDEPATVIDETVELGSDALEHSVAEQEESVLCADLDLDAAADESVDAPPEGSASEGLDETRVDSSGAVDSELLPVPDFSETSASDEAEGTAEVGSTVDETLATPGDKQTDDEQPNDAPLLRTVNSPSSAPSRTATPARSASPALEDVEEQTGGFVAAAGFDESVKAVLAGDEVPTRTAEPEVEESQVATRTSPTRPACDHSISLSTHGMLGAAVGTPARAPQPPTLESTTPVATPPTRLSTPSATGTAQTLVAAAPTARRQLTKLTSVASQRSGVPVKSSLTALTPAAASGSTRGLPVPSRLAAPRRGEETSSSRSDVGGATVASTIRQKAPAAQIRPGMSGTIVNPLRSSTLSASTSSTSSLEQSRAPRPLTRPVPRVTVAAHARSADVPSDSQARVGRPAIASRARLGPTIPVANAPMVSTRSGITTGPRQQATEPTRLGARPRPATTTRSLTSSTGSSHALAKTGSLTTVAPLTAAANGRTPRAALSMRQTTSAPILSASTTAVSPRKVDANPAKDDRLSSAGEQGVLVGDPRAHGGGSTKADVQTPSCSPCRLYRRAWLPAQSRVHRIGSQSKPVLLFSALSCQPRRPKRPSVCDPRPAPLSSLHPLVSQQRNLRAHRPCEALDGLSSANRRSARSMLHQSRQRRSLPRRQPCRQQRRRSSASPPGRCSLV